MALQWTSDFSVGETTIDHQHMELFQRFNDLLDACRQGRGKERVSLLLDFLDQYVVFHRITSYNVCYTKLLRIRQCQGWKRRR